MKKSLGDTCINLAFIKTTCATFHVLYVQFTMQYLNEILHLTETCHNLLYSYILQKYLKLFCNNI